MAAGDRLRHERDLRRAVLAGDEAAWQALYDAAFEPLLAYALWRCGQRRDLAEEVVQETWLVAVRRIREFDPERGSFLAWLRGIAANVLRAQLRRMRRPACPALDLDGVPAPSTAEIEQREQADAIARALAELPEHYEAVLRAKYLDRQSVEQIAAAWNETPKAIESLLTRARQAFRKAYVLPMEPDVSIRETSP